MSILPRSKTPKQDPRLPVLRGNLSLGDWFDDLQQAGWQYRGGLVRVHCPFCDSVHQHGWDLKHDYKVLGHRWAHCGDGTTPASANGYYVGLLRKTDPGCCHEVKPGAEMRRMTPKRLIQGGGA